MRKMPTDEMVSLADRARRALRELPLVFKRTCLSVVDGKQILEDEIVALAPATRGR
jgi:hypothetical protein